MWFHFPYDLEEHDLNVKIIMTMFVIKYILQLR